MNTYELSRAWFDFSFENPELTKPLHTAIFFFAIEHCNRLGNKEKFGFPSQMTMDAIGVKNYQTYSKGLNQLVEWGFIKFIEKSKNQYSANIITICAPTKNSKARGKALDKATIKHSSKQVSKQHQSTTQGIVSIDKPINQETNKPIKEEAHPLQTFIKNNLPNVSKIKTQLTRDDCERLIEQYPKSLIHEVLESLENYKKAYDKYNNVNLTIRSWIRLRESKNPKSTATHSVLKNTEIKI